MAGKPQYHHGDLRRTLLQQAEALIRQNGIDGLTLRKLADQVGVSQTALYHHFRDKNDLFCALGEESIDRFTTETSALLLDSGMPVTERLFAFVRYYIRYALENPELYELMLGRTTWRNNPTEGLRRKGRHALRTFAEMLMGLQAAGELPAEVQPLRLAQVSWGTLHGLCCLMNDGIFPKSEDVEAISRYALSLMHTAATAPPP